MYSVMEWYDNAQTFADATPVNVQHGVEISNIDFQIAVPQEGNQTISGRVTDLDNNPVVNASIYIQSAYYTTGYSFWSYATTDQDGNYRAEKVPAGNYFVTCWAQISWQSVYRWWPDAESIDQAKLVTVEDGSSKENIDFHLPITKETASISGTVHFEDGHPLAGATIQLSPYQNSNSQGEVKPFWIWAYGTSDSSGRYTISDLPSGSYTIYAYYWADNSLGQEWYNEKTSAESATPIVLEQGETLGNIDFTLNVHPIFGTLVGTITDSSTGKPIQKAYIEIKPVNSEIGSRCFMAWNYSTTTDENGKYIMEWLTEGEYQITVYADGGFAYYKDSIVPETATLVKITGGETVIADVSLMLRNDGTGVISGRVITDYIGNVDDSTAITFKRGRGIDRPTTNGAPINMAVVMAKPVVTIMVYPQSEMFYTAVTNPDGTYELNGLPPGEYYVSSFASYHLLKYYDDVFDPSEAAKVQVDGITPTTGIDFSLYPMLLCRDATENESGFKYNTSVNIFGKVEDEVGNPVAGAAVYLLDSAHQPISYVNSGSDGSYEINNIPAGGGNHYLQASKLGFDTRYNGNEEELSQTVPLNVVNGLNEVNFVLAPQGGSGIKPPEPANLPKTIELIGCYPNPFNPETTIRFVLPMNMHVAIRIFNPLGQEVASLWDGNLKAGQHDMPWNGRNINGEPAVSGLYIYRLESHTSIHSGKMVLLK
jgi:protocatechuate 3,4-dioxygenase beta subunit